MIDKVFRTRRARRATSPQFFDWTKNPYGIRLFFMALLEDGVYEVLVVDAEEVEEIRALRLELVVTSGPRKGEVVPLRVTNFDRDAVEMLGIPGVLSVHDGVPSFDSG